MSPAEWANANASVNTNTMRAWAYKKRGTPPNVLSLTEAMKKPTLPSDSSVLVQVAYTALNPVGAYVMQLVPECLRAKGTQFVPEMDFSGTIVEVGPGVPSERELDVGTSVFGSVDVKAHVRQGAGALAEYVAVEADSVVKKPASASLEEVAGLGVAGATAISLLASTRLEKGMKVLLNGASGGIGHIMVQLVKNAVGPDGRVVAVCSGKNAAMVQELGADEVIDYTEHRSLPQYLTKRFLISRFDAIFDSYGSQDLWTHCPKYLRAGQPFVTVGPAISEPTPAAAFQAIKLMLLNKFWPRAWGGVPRPYVQPNCLANLGDMAELAGLVDEGKLKILTETYRFEDAQKAYDKLLSRRAAGKIVIEIREDSWANEKMM
ncbi:putative oxidoreductase [Lineolata rhizophorae]|uniref:Putative oxidoreductase n=1 Tax=Lineolata rhizophorae TaxID=578093 RepID=A0A6A6NV48_9PEZI|nr:putative oxidoreductase [Lineolata rhizophorae]